MVDTPDLETPSTMTGEDASAHAISQDCALHSHPVLTDEEIKTCLANPVAKSFPDQPDSFNPSRVLRNILFSANQVRPGRFLDLTFSEAQTLFRQHPVLLTLVEAGDLEAVLRSRESCELLFRSTVV